MSRPRFHLSRAVGATAWAAAFVNAGFLVGASAERADVSIVLVAAIGIGVSVTVPAVTRLARRSAPVGGVAAAIGSAPVATSEAASSWNRVAA
jgi:membrane protein DedA with SNARE-associated domain